MTQPESVVDGINPEFVTEWVRIMGALAGELEEKYPERAQKNLIQQLLQTTANPLTMAREACSFLALYPEDPRAKLVQAAILLGHRVASAFPKARLVEFGDFPKEPST